MDKVLSVQRLSVLDLIDSSEVNKRASVFPPSEDEFDNVAVAEPEVAATEPLIMSMHVKEVMKFKKSFLRRMREDPEGGRTDWERFVAIKLDAREAMSMYPRTLPGATLLLDRHYTSLAPYRKGESNMYAVRKDGTCTVRYFETTGQHLILRPHNPAFPVEVMVKEDGLTPADYIVGRICFIGLET
jgi:hypothetical protein